MPRPADQLTWREATAADEPLLFALFCAGKAADFAPLGLSPQQLQPLFTTQFRARQLSYAQQFAAAADTVLCLADGTPVGRHLIERQPSCYRGLDLSVLPEHRNSGIGTWALRQIQQIAALEGLPFRLRVIRTNPALRLYEHLGFLRVSGDELSYEMEWSPRATSETAQGASPFSEGIATAELPGTVPTNNGPLPRAEVIDRIANFIRSVGLRFEFGPVPASTLLPGVQLVPNGMRVDTATLLYPGDLLHEAGHLALMTPHRRAAEFPSGDDPAEEMAALAWSYAAALGIGLPPEVVFHADGYKGQSQSLLHGYATNPQAIGIPILWWTGLTGQPGTHTSFPKMERWLREAPQPAETEVEVAAEVACAV